MIDQQLPFLDVKDLGEIQVVSSGLPQVGTRYTWGRKNWSPLTNKAIRDSRLHSGAQLTNSIKHMRNSHHRPQQQPNPVAGHGQPAPGPADAPASLPTEPAVGCSGPCSASDHVH